MEGALMMLDITIKKISIPKQKPSENDPLPFGTVFTDHMFVMDYTHDKGWHDARIVPYGDISISPAAGVLHYGQEAFEGLKAYKSTDGRTLLFRPQKNIERMNKSCQRLSMPEIPEEDYLQALKTLVALDKEWIPTKLGTSLYIRPVIFATQPHLGAKTSSNYEFIIMLSPSGLYYPEGLKPVSIWVEDSFVRAVRGGIGEAKTGGNYAASMRAQDNAHEAGYSQVLWLDGVERKYIEEVGAMNIFFKINGVIITPQLVGSILHGVTRNSVCELCKHWGYKVEERRISIDEIAAAYDNGTLEEVWGTGTAAIISPVGHLKWGDKVMTINNNQIGKLSQRLFDGITGIQLGKEKDIFGWTVEV
jgi:branched-chain amino acid aminotransferase